ncbi:MAG: HAD hydrolase family protein [Deltaproteobacteria bacterium]|nr:HAD hydrolase family protein [Deltaproteobacteria bacterium]
MVQRRFSSELKRRLRRIQLLLLDVDGVLTDGKIWLGSSGLELKAFDTKDGHGIKMAQEAGIRVGWISARYSPVVEARAKELGVSLVFQGETDKLLVYREILSQLKLMDSEVAYIGDDLLDIPLMKKVGVSVAVADAVDAVRGQADYVTRSPGGKGGVREFIDLLLDLQRFQ